jgi:hypothetical protein
MTIKYGFVLARDRARSRTSLAAMQLGDQGQARIPGSNGFVLSRSILDVNGIIMG